MTIWVIAEDLVARGLLASLVAWSKSTITEIALNPVYHGVRVHRPKTGERGQYPPGGRRS